MINTILVLDYLIVLLVVISTCFLAVALSKIKKEIKHNPEMILNQQIMALHITMVVLNLFVVIVVFGIESKLAPKGKPGLNATALIVLFTFYDLIQAIIVILFLKLATPSPKLMVKDSFVSSI